MCHHRDDSKHAFLQLAAPRLDCRDFRTGGHLAASTTGSDHRAPAMHRHVARAFLLRWCDGKTWQEASQGRRYRPEQDGTNCNGHTASAHKYQVLTPQRRTAKMFCFAVVYPHLAYTTDLGECIAVILVTSRPSVSHPRRYFVPEVIAREGCALNYRCLGPSGAAAHDTSGRRIDQSRSRIIPEVSGVFRN